MSTNPGDAIPRPLRLAQPVAADAAVRRSRGRPGRGARRRGLLRRRVSLGERLPDVAVRVARAARRAVSASTPASSETTATFAVAARRPRAPRRRRSSGAPVAAATTRRRRSRSFVVRRRDADHEVPERPPEPDHRDGRDRVQDELLRGAGLEPRRAGDELRPDRHLDRLVGERRELGAGGRRPARRSGRRPARRPESAPSDVRRLAARAHSDDDVGLRQRQRSDVGARRPRGRPRPPRLRAASASSPAATSATISPVAGRRTSLALERVELGEPAGGPGADVDEPPALRQSLDDRVDRAARSRRRAGGRRRGRRGPAG